MSEQTNNAKTFAIDDTIRIPIELEDEAGIAHVRAVFRRVKTSGSVGPRGLDPNHTLELRGNGQGQNRATVETTLHVGDQHVPGEYLCIAIQVYDPEGNLGMIYNPSPAKLIKIVEDSKRGRHGPRFLGWGENGG